jgi:hypothetical protein
MTLELMQETIIKMSKPFNIHDWQDKQKRLSEADDRPYNWRELPGYNPDAFYGKDSFLSKQHKNYDDPEGEGKMAKGDAIELAKDAEDVAEMIGPDTNLPEWVEAKITKAADYLNDVKDYLSNYDASRGDEEIDEANVTGTGTSISTGNSPAYATPHAFGDDKEKKLKTYKSIGYKPLK